MSTLESLKRKEGPPARDGDLHPLQPFDRGDFPPGSETNRGATGANGVAVKQDRTGPGLTFATTVLGAGHAQVITQDR